MLHAIALRRIALCTFRSAAVVAFATLTAVAQATPNHVSTFLGGTGTDTVQAVAVASNGDLLVAGETTSTDLPGTTGGFDDTYNGQGDAFVARLSSDGTQLLAATYLGGSFADEAVFVHEAGNGSIWVGGTTQAANFPTTANAFSTHNGRQDAFVANFDAGLATMLYGSTFGSPGRDFGEAFLWDEPNQRIYLSGRTVFQSSNVPVSATAFQAAATGGSALYVAALEPGVTSTVLAYGTVIDGSGDEREVGDLTLEGNGVITVSGRTNSTSFPVTAGAVQATGGGFSESGIVVRLDTQVGGAAALLYGTYIGGSLAESRVRHATDPQGVVHVLLQSNSTNLPLTANALIVTSGPNNNCYYAQIDPSLAGSAGLRYGSWVLTVGSAINPVIELAAGKVAMFMQTTAFGQLVTPGAFMSSAHGNGHGYILELDVSSQPDPFVSYATHYAGCPVPGSSVRPAAMAYDGAEVILGGGASRLPLSPGAFQSQPNSNISGFVARLELQPWQATTNFGTACAGSAGAPLLSATGDARLCRSINIEASSLVPFSIGLFLAGFSKTQHQSTPLPFSLATLGAAGCEILVAPDVTLVSPANATGVASLPFPLPNDPHLVGLEVFFQFAAVDPPANGLGLVTSDAVATQVRW